MKDPRAGFGTADEVVTDSDLDFNLNSLQASIEQLFSGAENDSLQTLTEKTQNRIRYLQYLQEQHDDLLLQFLKERVALESKYHHLYEPLYSKRYAILNGQLEVETVADVENDPDQGVPNFWLTAMKRNPVLAGEITPKDEEVLKFLTDIRFQNYSDRTGFELVFSFEANVFFKNTVLTKAVLFGEDCKPKAPPTVIEWYDGKWTQKSFFNFFNPPKVLEDRDLENDSENFDLLDQLDQDCAIGMILRDKIIPHAVSWFTGEALKRDRSG